MRKLWAGIAVACASLAFGGVADAKKANPRKAAIATVAREWGPCLKALGVDAGTPDDIFVTGKFVVVGVSRSPVANFGVKAKTPGKGSFPLDNKTRDTIALAEARGGVCP